MEILEKIKSLNIPIGKYIVIGSSILEVKGIRKANDIDILILDGEFDKLRTAGFQEKRYPDGNITLVGNNFEISNKFISGYRQNPGVAISKAEIINGVPFMTLRELIKYKQFMRRVKDLKDIKLIKSYLDK